MPRDYEDIAQILSHVRALEIMEALANEPSNFTSLVETLSTSTDVISRHLKNLMKSGLVVRSERDGREVEYHLTEDGRQAYEKIQELQDIIHDSSGFGS